MPIERDMQWKQIHNTEHTSGKLFEQLLTTNMVGKMDIFDHVFNHRHTNRCMSVNWMTACHMYHVLEEEMLYIKTLNPSWVVVAHAYNQRKLGGRGRWISKFEASLV